MKLSAVSTKMLFATHESCALRNLVIILNYVLQYYFIKPISRI